MSKRQGSETRQRTALMAIRMTPDEKQRIVEAAASNSVSVGQFVRDAALAVANRLLASELPQ